MDLAVAPPVCPSAELEHSGEHVDTSGMISSEPSRRLKLDFRLLVTLHPIDVLPTGALLTKRESRSVKTCLPDGDSPDNMLERL